VKIRAVVFDLWQTLAVWPLEEGRALYGRMAAQVGVDADRFFTAWDSGRQSRETGPMRDYLAVLGQELGVDMDGIGPVRLEFTREVLVPRSDAVSTLGELRRRGYRLGLITNCSEEVQQLWNETAFAESFDALVFSCDVGAAKPDPRIYAIASERLGVAPDETAFVGDGDNDELSGAERAGMRAIQLRVPDEQLSPAGAMWEGERVNSLSDLLDILE
jgi:putative hydrolase of the HAD superfamily